MDWPVPSNSQAVTLLGSYQKWFGHSYLSGGGATHIDRQLLTLLQGMMRADVTDLGVGASQMANDQLWTQSTNGGGQNGWGGWAWALQNINPYRTAAPYTPGINYLPGILTGLNDCTQRSHQTTGAPRTIFKTALRTLLSRLCASRVYECAYYSSGIITSGSANITAVYKWEGLATGMKLSGPGIPTTNTISSFTAAGNGTLVMSATATASSTLAVPYFGYDPALAFGGLTWQPFKLDINKNSGEAYLPIPGNTATITFTIPADFEGGTVAFSFTVWPAGDGQITWSGTAVGFVGGVALASAPTSTLVGLAYADGTDAATQNTNQRHSSNGHVVRVTGLTSTDASKTIIATYGSGAGTTFSTPAALGLITHGGTVGVTTYTYTHFYRTYNGDTLQSAVDTTATGNATLSGTNTNIIPAGAAWPSGVESEIIVRTVGGTTQGAIALLTAGPAAVTDTGLVATGYVSPTANPLVGGAAFNAVWIESFNPVTRGVVCNIPTPTTATLAALTPTVNATDVANYNADIASVISEFSSGQFLLVDVDSALGGLAANFNATGNVHPNDRGHAIAAKTIAAAVQSWVQGIPFENQAMQSRVARRVVSRTLAVRRWNGSPPGSPYPVAASPTDLLGFSSAQGTDYTLPAAFTQLDNANLILYIDAQIGDDLEVELAGLLSNVATSAGLDIAFCNASLQPIRFFSGPTGIPDTQATSVGWPAWADLGLTAVWGPVTGSAFATVRPGDLQVVNTVQGIAILALYGYSTSGARVLFGGGSSGSPPLVMQARNLGQRNTPGFNAS